MPATTITLRVRYAETDQMHVVHHATYFTWFEVARTELMRSLGWSYRAIEDEGIMLPVIDACCQYRKPARYDDEVEIAVDGQLMSRVRVAFGYDVRVKGGADVLATGRTVHAAIDRNGRPCRLPERVLEVFA